MEPLLDWLYQSDLGISHNEDYEHQCSAALDDVLRAENAVKSELFPAHLTLVTDYAEKIQLYHSLDGPFQFERGFLFGAKILLWIAQQKIQAPDQS